MIYVVVFEDVGLDVGDVAAAVDRAFPHAIDTIGAGAGCRVYAADTLGDALASVVADATDTDAT